MTQAQALEVMRRGDSVFLTGPAGSGKTYVLNKFIAWAKRQGKQVAVTASTGIAATHLGGTTIHSWSGLGIRESLSEQDLTWLKNNTTLLKRYSNTDILIIDEVSMLHGKRLDMVNQACKLCRSSDLPFGGLQVVLTGDLFQLPPINREGGDDDFAHLSAAWQELAPKICYLSEQHRQVSDPLLDILTAMRRNEVNEAHEATLQARLGLELPTNLVITKLYSHNADVESINQGELDALPGETRSYQMATGGRAQYAEQLIKSVLAPETLELKIGAEVMFVANNFAAGFVNGTRGKVAGFRGDQPIVALHQNGREITVEPHNWSREEDGREIARVTQLPLRLAWAITIHKSQGMSLDAALIDLSRSFTYGMGYVALSRVRSLEGLYLHGINRNAMQLHPAIYEFDQQLQQASAMLAQEIGEVGELSEPAAEPAEQPASSQIDEALGQKLRAWRLQKAEAAHMPAYIIAHNSLLDQLAARKPLSERELLTISGFGPRKAEAYGQELLALIAAHLGTSVHAAEPEQVTGGNQLVALFRQGTDLNAVCEELNIDPATAWRQLQESLSVNPKSQGAAGPTS